MNFNNLTPEQMKLILDLNKRIEVMESRLEKLQDKLVRVDGPLITKLAKDLGYLNLN